MVTLAQRPRKYRRGTPGRRPVRGPFVHDFFQARGNAPVALADLHRAYKEHIGTHYPHLKPTPYRMFHQFIHTLKRLGWLEVVGPTPRDPSRMNRLPHVPSMVLVRLTDQGLATPPTEWQNAYAAYLTRIVPGAPPAPPPAPPPAAPPAPPAAPPPAPPRPAPPRITPPKELEARRRAALGAMQGKVREGVQKVLWAFEVNREVEGAERAIADLVALFPQVRELEHQDYRASPMREALERFLEQAASELEPLALGEVSFPRLRALAAPLLAKPS